MSGWKILALVAATTWVGGCQGASWSGRKTGPDSASSPGGGTVLTAKEIGDGMESLLQVMHRRIPGLEVRDHSPCPAISLRGQNTAPGITEPAVYVDGARATNTCVLSGLTAADVERVEIYPMGVTPRGGYATNAHGLILVFMKGR
ncbi:MAG TPA: Plug domain-containing protein [Longimicrobiales bacterium]